jgi:hypothetical protein
MKKLFFFLFLLVISVAGMSQATGPFPNYQPQGSPTTRWSQQGAVQGMKGIINGVYPDTLTANNTSYIDYYPGAQIFTTADSAFWLRNPTATRWMRATGSVNITSFTFNNDTTGIICFGNGVCDTFSIVNLFDIVTNIVNNFNDSSFFQINDSTLLFCVGFGAERVCDTVNLGNSDTYNIFFDSTSNSYFVVTCDTLQTICIGDSCYQQQTCDTIPIQRVTSLQFQNALYRIPGTPIIELGDPFPGEGGKNLYRPTWINANPGYLIVRGKLLAREPFSVQQAMPVEESPSIQSWFHIGRGYSAGIDNPNTVSLYASYTDPFYNDSSGFVKDRAGYLFNTNGRGIRYGISIDNVNSKQSGFLLHTLDTANRDAMTIFGAQTPKSMNFPSTPSPTSTWYENRIAVFKTTGQQQNPFYGVGTFAGLPAKYLLGVDSIGNIIETQGAGDVITIINDTTINICSFGTNLCDTITINNIGNLQTVTILNDSTIIVCGESSCDTLTVHTTTFSQSITANNGLIMSTPTNVQLGQGVAAAGNPAILLSHREIPMGGFTLSLNASASQAVNIFQTKNSSAAIRARITSAAAFSNTGGFANSEMFGDGAAVGATGSLAVGSNASSGVGQNIAIGNGAIITGSITGITLIGVSATHSTSNNATLVGSGITSTGRSTGVGLSGVFSSSNNFGFGEQVNVSHTYSGALGFGATTTANNQLVIGSSQVSGTEGGINDIYWGEGVVSIAPNDVSLNPNGGSGTNIAGSDLYINGSKATGDAAGGPVIIQTAVAGASGTTLQSLTPRMTVSSLAATMNSFRFEEAKGVSVVAAGDLGLGLDGNLFTITGATQINAITTANWQAGSTIGLIFTGAPLVKHNTAGGAGTATMLLAGAADFQAAAGDNIEFRYDGTNWHEIGRTLATSGSGPTMTADNGLSKNTATNVQLGATNSGVANSPLLHNSYINTGSFRLYAYGESATLPPLTANNFSGGPAFHAISSTGPAVYAQSNSGAPVQSVLTSSNQNSTLEILRLNRETTGGGGVGQVGIGAYIDMLLQTSTTAGQLANRFNTEFTVVTHGSQTSKLTISGVSGGSVVEELVLGGEGYMKLRPITATAASAITPAEGMLVFVSDTDATFLTVGIWCYQNGAWKAL